MFCKRETCTVLLVILLSLCLPWFVMKNKPWTQQEIAIQKDREAWRFLDLVETPTWVNLTQELTANYTDLYDYWFHISHPYHRHHRFLASSGGSASFPKLPSSGQVYGGGIVGLMGLISQKVYVGGCHVLGVIRKALMLFEEVWNFQNFCDMTPQERCELLGQVAGHSLSDVEDIEMAYIYMVLEFAGKGALNQELHKRKYFSERRAATYIATFARALLYCHEKHVIHRDIKPENVLVDEQGQLKLADFGQSVHTFSRRDSIVGTIDYLAPEMVREKMYDASVDILGVMCYEFLYGDTPFYDEELPDTYKRIKQLDLKFPSIPVISSNAKDLITKMLIKNASRRLSLHGVLEHSWIQENAYPSGIFRR